MRSPGSGIWIGQVCLLAGIGAASSVSHPFEIILTLIVFDDLIWWTEFGPHPTAPFWVCASVRPWLGIFWGAGSIKPPTQRNRTIFRFGYFKRRTKHKYVLRYRLLTSPFRGIIPNAVRIAPPEHVIFIRSSTQLHTHAVFSSSENNLKLYTARYLSLVLV